jgi:hypothetical protein
MKFSTGTEGIIQKIKVFFQTPTAVAFGDIARYTVRGIDAIGSNFFQLKWKPDEDFVGQHIKGNRVLPDSKLFESSIDVLPFRHSVKPLDGNRRILEDWNVGMEDLNVGIIED